MWKDLIWKMKGRIEKENRKKRIWKPQREKKTRNEIEKKQMAIKKDHKKKYLIKKLIKKDNIFEEKERKNKPLLPNSK